MIKLSISADADRWLLSYLGALPFFLLAFDPADPALCPSLTATQGQTKPRMLLPRRPHLSIDVSQSLNMSIIASDCGRHGVPPPLRSLAARLVPPNRIAPDGRPTFLGRQFRQRRRLTRPRPTMSTMGNEWIVDLGNGSTDEKGCQPPSEHQKGEVRARVSGYFRPLADTCGLGSHRWSDKESRLRPARGWHTPTRPPTPFGYPFRSRGANAI